MNFNFFKRNFSQEKSNKLLLILIIMDVLFIFAHALFIFLIYIRVDFDWSIVDMFMVNYDGSYPEIFQYLKYFSICLICLYIIKKRKEYSYISWFFLFLLLLLDDALQFHELFAEWVVEKFDYVDMIGLRAQDLGELTYVALFGPLLLVMMFFGYKKGSQEYKKTTIDIGLLFAIFLFFGIVVDILHELIGSENRYVKLLITLIEDGGEMLALSLLVWYFYFIVVKPITCKKYLYQILRKEAQE